MFNNPLNLSLSASFKSTVNDHGPTWDTFTVNGLEKDAWHDIRIEFYENGGGATLDLYHSNQSTLVSELRGSSAGSFTINSSTGAVTLSDNPDYEANSSYTFKLIATDAANNSTFKEVSLAINDVSAASVPDLSASSDTGASNSDNITSDNTPTFTGNAEASSTVELFAGSSSLGTKSVDSSGNWSFTVDSSAAFSDGSYAITAKATDAAGNVSNASSALSGVGCEVVAVGCSCIRISGQIRNGRSRRCRSINGDGEVG